LIHTKLSTKDLITPYKHVAALLCEWTCLLMSAFARDRLLQYGVFVTQCDYRLAMTFDVLYF